MNPEYKKKDFLIAFAVVFGCIALLQAVCHFPVAAMPEPHPEAGEIPQDIGDTDIADSLTAVVADSTDSDTPLYPLVVDTTSLKTGTACRKADTAVRATTTATATTEATAQKASTERRPRRPLRAGSTVWSYPDCFPDVQDVQLPCAQRVGITPPQSRDEIPALLRQHKLVDITTSPFYVVDELTHSLPYLVPRAQQLLNTIAVNFLDSLRSKGMQPHLPIISSVLRTTDDVARLQHGNRNATTNSCHCYGTTIDIAYHRFQPLDGTYPYSQVPPTRWNDDLKFVMAEVLYDLRQQGRCYVKYERKQACFHLTVR